MSKKKNPNAKRILIIGGSGFIGKNSIIKFTEYHLGDMLNMDKQESVLGIKTIYVELKYPILSEIRRFSPEYIIYLASLNEYECKDLKEAYKVNVEGLEKVLEELIDYDGLKKFIYVSDYKLYLPPIPFKEDNKIHTSNNYLKTKYAAERVCFKYINQFGMPIIIFRSSHIYGPYDKNPTDDITSFIESAYKYNSIHVYNNNVYDYLYITDFIKALIMSFDTLYTGILNIGTGQCYESVSIAKYISAKLQVKYVVDNNTVYNVYLNDISLAKDVLGVSTFTNINLGIDHLIEYYKYLKK